MKDQYFGDIGDYGKYGLLRFLAEHGVSISVNWYLTPDDGSVDGKFVRYLSDERYRRYCPALYDALRECVVERGRRDVSVMSEAGLIPGARYFTEPLPVTDGASYAERCRLRREWHKRALAFCAGAELVFLDPDNGIRPEGQRPSQQSEKYALLEEAADYWNAGQNVVYYCHKGRRTAPQWAAYKRSLCALVPAAEPAGLTFHRGTQRSYIFALHDEAAEGIKRLLDEFLSSEWGGSGMFTYEPI